MSTELLRIPLARLGRFQHDRYGELGFDEADFQELIQNFKANARGYEPYVRYGHNEKGIGIWSGEEALGHAVELRQEADQLVGYFEPNEEGIVEKIRSGKYRYSSAEILRKAKNPETGVVVGKILKGVGLTNEPSIPGLHRTSVVDSSTLSLVLADDAEVVYTIQLLGEPMDPEKKTDEQAPANADPAAAKTPEAPTAPVAAPVIDLSAITKALETGFGDLKSLIQDQKQAASPTEQPKAPEASAGGTVGEPAKVEDENKKPSEAGAPTVTDTQAPVQKEDTMSAEVLAELKKLQTEMAQSAKANAEAAEAMKAQIEAVKADSAAAVKAAEDKVAEAASVVAKMKADAEGRQLELALGDRAREAVQNGVAPALANKAAAITKSIRQAASGELQLSDGGKDLEADVWALASMAGSLSYGQDSVQLSDSKPEVSSNAKAFLEGLKANKQPRA